MTVILLCVKFLSFYYYFTYILAYVNNQSIIHAFKTLHRRDQQALTTSTVCSRNIIISLIIWSSSTQQLMKIGEWDLARMASHWLPTGGSTMLARGRVTALWRHQSNMCIMILYLTQFRRCLYELSTEVFIVSCYLFSTTNCHWPSERSLIGRVHNLLLTNIRISVWKIILEQRQTF